MLWFDLIYQTILDIKSNQKKMPYNKLKMDMLIVKNLTSTPAVN
jgi:hypothetical protein